jgi:[ribosomal protein S18]-alanine N-acetyltransferase
MYLTVTKPMIRPIALTDLDLLLEIEEQSFPKSPYSLTTFVHLFWLYPETFWAYIDQSADQKKEQICAYLIFSREGHLISLAVHPSYRRRGIGESLLREALKTLPAKKIRAEVRRSNRVARAFYQKVGFQIAGVLSNYYGNEDALIVHWTPASSHPPG